MGGNMFRFLNLAFSFALLSLSIPAETDKPSQPTREIQHLFATAENCMSCHNGLITPSGEDVSIGFHWRSSMMANSARDPYWQAAVRREVTDHPGAQSAIENECSACHMPMSRFLSKVNGRMEGVFTHLPQLQDGDENDQLAADGVSCTMCHQITSEGFGTRESFVAGFKVDTSHPVGDRMIYGPHVVDSGRTRIMQSSSLYRPEQSEHIQESEHCATCHTLFTHAFDSTGKVAGELPEQVPYLEWLHSSYRELQSCQDCHMKAVSEMTAISSVLGEPREGFSRHSFRGGNFFMPRIFSLYRDELSVKALTTELNSTTVQTLEHLRTDSARVTLKDISRNGRNLDVEIQIKSMAGHKLPTAYPSRRAWIHFKVEDSNKKVIFESGRFNEDGSIQGNDNDIDPARYEIHHNRIDNPEQVQIYEPILADPAGNVTTGLLTASQYLKDNRLLPLGFNKKDANEDIAVKGKAVEDPDFTAGGDTVVYSVSTAGSTGPFTIIAKIYYQPIGYRWAQNFKDYNSMESGRFVRYYDSLAKESAAVLAEAKGFSE
jgi:hypothetical protein